MKRTNLMFLFISMLVISFALLGLSDTKVLGQAQDSNSLSQVSSTSTSTSSTSTSSTSSGVSSTSTSSTSSGVSSTSTSSTSSGGVSSTSTSSTTGGVSSTSSTTGGISSTSTSSTTGGVSSTSSTTGGISSTFSTTGGISSTSSSTSGGSILSSTFTGTWQAKVDKATTIDGILIQESSRNILLKLCVDGNGEIMGFVDEPGLFDRAVIISQTINSNNEIDLQLKDIKGKNGSLHLVLNGEGSINGEFSNGINFIASRTSSISSSVRTCLDLAVLPNASISSSSSSTGGVSLNTDFSGAWRGSVTSKVTVGGDQVGESSRNIKLNLCADGGEIVGFVTLPGFFNRAGIVISQTIKSENEVSLELKDIKGKMLSLDLKLNGNELNGTFSNGISFVATNQVRFSPGTVCLDFGVLPDFSVFCRSD